jgi:hypothetical protein
LSRKTVVYPVTRYDRTDLPAVRDFKWAKEGAPPSVTDVLAAMGERDWTSFSAWIMGAATARKQGRGARCPSPDLQSPFPRRILAPQMRTSTTTFFTIFRSPVALDVRTSGQRHISRSAGSR